MSWQRLFYSVVLYTTVPIMLLRLWQRGSQQAAYRQRIAERFGHVSRLYEKAKQRKIICVHAVSVGETIAARPLIEYLLQHFPECRVWITSTTPTGSAMVDKLFSGRVKHSYLPYDLPHTIKRFLHAVDPCLFLVMETELWPNLYAQCARKQIPLLLINARLSARSAKRYAMVKALTQETLAGVSLIAARHVQDADFFKKLGAQDQQLQVYGNIKFALQLEDTVLKQAESIIVEWGKHERLIWCAASTHEGEDEQFLKIQRQLSQQLDNPLLILVPRHPERFELVANLCKQTQLPLVRRSEHVPIDNDTAVFLGDTLGELLIWYALCDIAVVGGSFVERGGHNPLEAALLGKPVISGPYIDNFVDIYPELVDVGGAKVVNSDAELAILLQNLLNDRQTCSLMGKAGKLFMMRKQKNINKLFTAVGQYIH